MSFLSCIVHLFSNPAIFHHIHVLFFCSGFAVFDSMIALLMFVHLHATQFTGASASFPWTFLCALLRCARNSMNIKNISKFHCRTLAAIACQNSKRLRPGLGLVWNAAAQRTGTRHREVFTNRF